MSCWSRPASSWSGTTAREASAIYDQVLAIDPSSFSANLGKAQVLRSSGEPENAVNYYKEALRRTSRGRRHGPSSAPCLEQLKRFEERRRSTTVRWRSIPRYLRRMEGRYRTVLAQEKWPEVVEAASNLLAQKPELDIHKANVNALIKSQRFKEALELGQPGAQGVPRGTELLSHKRDISVALGMGTRIVKYVRRSLRNPHDPESMYQMGVAYSKAMRFP
jgi:tetratricopeptide (TPR) repeat protein